ncbi:MAG: hypothetical protein J7604_04850 [Sporocytophaga sp.]|nr:hypothetical protein [Sporocytophaga sp.]
MVNSLLSLPKNMPAQRDSR